MKRLLLVLPFVIAACDGALTAPSSTAPDAPSFSAKGGSCLVPVGGVLTEVGTGFDANGYNRCAHLFNGTFAGYCAARNAPATCGGVAGSTTLIMKWNAEWDRGNAEHWTDSFYAAHLDNEAKGAYLDGTTFSEHFKTRWDAGCVSSGGVASTNGGGCIWGQFEVLMDQGKEDGEHQWWAKLAPAGYGN